MKSLHIITLSLVLAFPYQFLYTKPIELHNLKWSNLKELTVTPKHQAFASLLALGAWLEKCTYYDNHVTASHAADGYKTKNPITHSWNILRDVVVGAGHRYIPHPRIPLGYKPGYGLLGSIYSGIKHSTEGLYEVKRVKQDIEYWLNWLKNLKFD